MVVKKQRKTLFLAGVVSVATLLVYLPALRNGFVLWDDDVYILNNQHIRSLDSGFLRWAFTGNSVNYWHPLAWASHAVDYALWGLNPLGHHLSSVLLHGINTFLVVVLAARLLEIGAALRPPAGPAGGSSFPDERTTLIAAGVTGLLFGVHPLHVESVAWVSERKDLLCALFFLLSVGAYLSYASDKSHRSYKTYFLSLLLFLLALMSKPMAVTLPAVLLLLDWYPLGRISSKKDAAGALLEKLPFVVLSIFASVAAVSAQDAMGAIVPLGEVSFGARIAAASSNAITYLWRMAVPLHLSPFYPAPREIAFWSLPYLASLLLTGAVTAACILPIRRRKMMAAAWGYYLITLAPVIGLVKVGSVSEADRFTYLPGLGPSLLMGLAVAWAWNRSGSLRRWGPPVKRLAAVAGICAVVSLSYLTVKQIAVWKSTIALWSYVINAYPDRVPQAYLNRGLAYGRSGQLDRALEDFTAAAILDPGSADAHMNRGVALGVKGRYAEATDELDEAIRLRPGSSEAYLNRAATFEHRGQLDRALSDYDRAIQLSPGFYQAYGNRGIVLGSMGRTDEAVADYTKAIFLKPDYADAYAGRGGLYMKTGRKEEALRDFQEACRLESEEGCAALETYGKR